MKKSNKNYPVLIILLLAVISCRKDDDSIHDYVPGLSGTWRFVQGIDLEKYLVINKDRTCSILSSDVQGIKDRNDAILLVTSDQLMIDNSDPDVYPNINIYNYTVKGDTLALASPGQKIVLVRDKNSTTTASWIKNLNAIVSYKAPVSEPTDITFDGTSIWYGNGYNTHYLYSLNPANGSFDSLSVNQYAWSVEADGDNLWVGSDGTDNVELIDKTSGNTITSSVSMGAWIYGIAKDGDFLWCFSNNEGTLYKYSITGNTVPLSIKIAGNWDGLAMAENYLYVAANGKLHKCTSAPLSGIASYQLPGYYIYGAAYDGNSFWVSAYKPPDGWPEIIKLSGVN